MDIASGTKFSLSPALNVVDIIFHHDFSSNQVDLIENNNDCFKPVHHAEVVRCAEYAHLLRSVAVTEKWQRQQRRQGYFLLTDTGAGIREVHAHLIRVHDSAVKAVHATHQAGRVTGRVIRYSPDVKTYTFYDLNTHVRSKINATPEHRFYVVNKRAFIPLSKITSEDQLINASGRSVKLLYAVKNGGNSKKHLLPVYNLEVSDHHLYFAGVDRILVHNGCFDEFPSDYLADKSIEEAAWFVNSQVNRYIKHSLTRMLINPKYFEGGPMGMLPNPKEKGALSTEQVLHYIQANRRVSYGQTSKELTEQVAIQLAIMSGCGNSAEMCLVGKKVLETHGFRESVRFISAGTNSFLELGDTITNTWISNLWGKTCFPMSEIGEKLLLYKNEFDSEYENFNHGVNGKLLSCSDYARQYTSDGKVRFFEVHYCQ